mgnify:CR=1 FL=1
MKADKSIKLRFVARASVVFMIMVVIASSVLLFTNGRLFSNAAESAGESVSAEASADGGGKVRRRRSRSCVSGSSSFYRSCVRRRRHCRCRNRLCGVGCNQRGSEAPW